MYLYITRGIVILLGAEIAAKMITFSPRNTNIYKICKLIRKRIFFILYNISPLKSKLCNSTNRRILFLAVAKYFVFLTWIEG